MRYVILHYGAHCSDSCSGVVIPGEGGGRLGGGGGGVGGGGAGARKVMRWASP